MIAAYTEIAKALEATKLLRWIDIAPRVADHTNDYPAAYISVGEEQPASLLGGLNGMAEIDFSVEYWLKPYHSSTVVPYSPVLVELGSSFDLINNARKAIFDWQGEAVQNTTLLSELVEKQADGFYIVTQRWRGLTSMWATDFSKIELPPPTFKSKLGNEKGV